MVPGTWISVKTINNPVSAKMNPKNMTTLRLRKSIGRSPLRRVLVLIPLAFACFAFAPQTRATCQEGYGTTNNTFLGDNALISNITSNDNTAIGFQALLSNTTGNYNTAIGSQALYNNNGYDNTANGYQA